jgi:hypothetical protein
MSGLQSPRPVPAELVPGSNGERDLETLVSEQKNIYLVSINYEQVPNWRKNHGI